MVPLLLLAAAFPIEIDTPLHNPHKGWVYIDHATPTEIDAGRSVSQCADGTAFEWYQHVAVLSTWALIEEEPGAYDWSYMDRSIDYWRSQGKQIHLRFSTDEFNNIPGCPRWIFKAGVPEYRRGHLRYPDYSHSYYRERLSLLLQALADKYADAPYLETVNLQGYGNFGEWHSGYNYDTVAARVAALRGIVDIWRDAFAGRRFLNLSSTYEWRTVANTGTPLLPHGTSINAAFRPSYDDFRGRSAFDYALDFPDITVSRHGVGGAVRLEYDGRMIANFFQHWRKPLFMEFFGNMRDYTGPSIVGFAQTGEGDDHVENGVDELLTHHPNFATPMGWGSMGAAAQFYNEYSHLVREGHKRMGYRFVLTHAAFSPRVAPGGRFVLRHSWENRAMGRCFVRYPLALFFMRGDDVVWRIAAPGFDQRYMVSGETYDFTSDVVLPETLEPGEYELRVAMVDETGAPALRLAIAGDDGQQRYPLGKVVVEAGAPQAPVVQHRLPERDGARWLLHGLEPDTTYWVRFDYAVNRNSDRDLDTDDPGYFRIYADGTEGDRRDEVRWFDKAGQPTASKSALITTGDQGPYTLIWDAVGGGDMVVSNVAADRVPAGQVRALDLWSNAVQRDERLRRVERDRAYARKDRSEVNLPDDWCDMVRTVPDAFPLAPDTVYTVWFDWSATPALYQGDYFYLSQRNGADERRQFRWTQRHTSNPVRHAYTFRTGSESGDYLIWGMKNGGEATLLNVRLVTHAAEGVL